MTMRSCAWRVVVAATVALIAGAPMAADAASQFHLSLVGNGADGVNYMLDWVTPATDESSVLLYGASADALDEEVAAKSAGAVEESGGASVTCWSALLANLAPGQTVHYKLKADAAAPQSFTVPEAGITWAVFGDLGAPMQKQAAGISLTALKSELVRGAYQGVLNLGDISYELVKENGQNYMEAIEPIGSQVPIQATIGNHEHEHAMAPEFALQNYRRRFAGLAHGAGTVSGSGSSEFFSFSSGLIHFAFINTEVYGAESYMTEQPDGTFSGDESARRAAAVAQASWLEYDLSRVDRAATPFVVLCGHRPPFKTPNALSEPGNKFAQEIVPIMSKYGVDLYLSGHEHTYLVFEASTFGEYTIPPIIISGSSGNNEYIRDKAQLKIVGFTEKTLIPRYGFGYLTATADALEWTWGTSASENLHHPEPQSWELADSFTIPRREALAPSDKAGAPVQEPVAVESLWATGGAETDSASNSSSSTNSGAGSGGASSEGEVDSAVGTLKPGDGASQAAGGTSAPSSTSSADYAKPRAWHRAAVVLAVAYVAMQG